MFYAVYIEAFLHANIYKEDMHKVRHNNHHSHEDKPLQSWSRNLATKYLKNLKRIAKLRELIRFCPAQVQVQAVVSTNQYSHKIGLQVRAYIALHCHCNHSNHPHTTLKVQEWDLWNMYICLTQVTSAVIMVPC